MSRSVEEIMNRHLVSVPNESLSGEQVARTGQLVAKTGVSSAFKPKGKKRDVLGQDVQVIPPFVVNLLYLQWLMLQLFCQEVLEVYSSFRPEVPTFITADRMEQVGLT